jgi:hypothetical protein
MDESTNQGEAFEHYRVLLFSIAYRMTGSASEAEGLVLETRCMRRTGNAEPSQEALPNQEVGGKKRSKSVRISPNLL